MNEQEFDNKYEGIGEVGILDAVDSLQVKQPTVTPKKVREYTAAQVEKALADISNTGYHIFA